MLLQNYAAGQPSIPAKPFSNLRYCKCRFKGRVTDDSGELLLRELGVQLVEDLLESGRGQATLLVLHQQVSLSVPDPKLSMTNTDLDPDLYP